MYVSLLSFANIQTKFTGVNWVQLIIIIFLKLAQPTTVSENSFGSMKRHPVISISLMFGTYNKKKGLNCPIFGVKSTTTDLPSDATNDTVVVISDELCKNVH